MNRKTEQELERQEANELFDIKLKYAFARAQRDAFVRRMARGKLDAKKRRLTK